MKRYLVTVLVALASLFVFWMPFLFKANTIWGVEFGGHGMETIVQNFDGPNYLAVAKTLYDPVSLSRDFVGFENPPIYYAAHFPLYPLLIRALDIFMTGPQALLCSIIISNILLAIAITYFFEILIKDKRLAIVIAVFALFFPARMLSVRGVGSSEPLFMFFVLSSLAMAYQSKHWMSSILGSLAVLTRSPGIFLFGVYLLTLWRKPKDLVPYFLLPITLALLFAFYGYRYGNFWAYFNSSAELHPVFFPPFLIFSNTARWISDIWREDIIYIYLLYGLGIYLVRDRTAKIFGMVMGGLLLLIAHRDLARYAIPIAPIMLLGFAPYLSTRQAKWLLMLILPIYLLGWQFVVGNIQPISDWSKLL